MRTDTHMHTYAQVFNFKIPLDRTHLLSLYTSFQKSRADLFLMHLAF